MSTAFVCILATILVGLACLIWNQLWYEAYVRKVATPSKELISYWFANLDHLNDEQCDYLHQVAQKYRQSSELFGFITTLKHPWVLRASQRDLGIPDWKTEVKNLRGAMNGKNAKS